MRTNSSAATQPATVSENKARLISALVSTLVISFLLYSNWIIPLILVIDFFLRGFNNSNYSPLKFIARLFLNDDEANNKQLDKDSLEFSARFGFVLSDVIFILVVIGFYQPAFYFAIVLLSISLLEAIVGIFPGHYLFVANKRINKPPESGRTYILD